MRTRRRDRASVDFSCARPPLFVRTSPSTRPRRDPSPCADQVDADRRRYTRRTVHRPTFGDGRSDAVDQAEMMCSIAAPSHEAHLPASQHSARADPRLPRSDGHLWWSQGHQQPPRQGPAPSHADDLQEVTDSGAGSPASSAPATLGRPRRVRRRADFVRVQDTGAKAQGRHFLLLASPTASPDGMTRLGVVASKRVGGAVERNRCKRLVREVFRHHAAEFPTGVDVVVVARPGAQALAYSEAEAEICSALPALTRRVGHPSAPRARR